jgi:hypothetical protein
LRRLADRYPQREASRLSPRSSQALATLVDDHAAALRSAIDAIATRITPLLSAPGADAPADRLSIMQTFTDVNTLHTETHAMLAGGSLAAVASSITSASADDPDARQAVAAMLLSRLRRIAYASSQPDFASELLSR